MPEIVRNAARKVCAGVTVALCLAVAATAPCYAQSAGGGWASSLQLGGIERYIGPVIPPNGLGATFRSEIGSGVATAPLSAAKLTGSVSGTLNLQKTAPLDKSPLRFDTYAILRLWRFGARAAYTNLETRSLHTDLGQVNFSGLVVGGDFDIVHHPWCSLGVAVDLFAFDPQFQGSVMWPVAGARSMTLDLKGRKPSTIGGYLRYVPPEILGYPLHVEAFFRAPLLGSQVKNYGLSLAFRPQIYRFDASAKLLYEKFHLKFASDPDSQLSQDGFVPNQNWEVDMEWDLYGIEFSFYF